MSITHILELQSQRTATEVLDQLLSSDIGLQPASYDQMKAEGDGLYGRIVNIEKFSKNFLLKRFGVNIDISAIFDEDFDGDRDAALEALGKAIALLLREEKGDAMFFWVVDTPILKRAKGTIKVINEPEFDWLRDALDEASLNYELKSVEEIRGVQS